MRERRTQHQAPESAATDPSPADPRPGRGEASPEPREATPEAATSSHGTPRDAREQPAAAPAEDPAQPPAHSDPAHDEHAALGDLLGGDDGDDSHHHTKKRRRGRGGCLVALLIVVAILGGLFAAGAWAVNTYGQRVADQFGISLFGFEPTPTDYEPGQATGETTITISEGDTGWEVSVALHDAGVTLTEAVFYDMLVAAQVDPQFMPGTYVLQEKMTAKAALTALEDPENKIEDAVSYPEGYTLEDIVPRIAAGLDVGDDKVRAALDDPSEYGVDADTLEGWLFPATYQFEPDTTAKQAIQEMVDRTRESLDAAGVPNGEAERILTIASIIQREARYDDDFYKVSRVIENRLDESVSETGGKLQMDSTAQYGYGEMHEGRASSSAEALNDDNPWNTYVHAGLPVGPISNPGDLAIDAAMHPADGSWQFFVTVNLDTGETVFSDTYEEHQEHVAEWDKWCTANPGSGC
ncbi:endolytic transglycosylase MltG [Microbacterium sp. G2-8]|uniref:endolytic transglycosylase MltG n=1 Tax=Microbacterium sp. G2-8 TaxID=2842454 RepID=UPI001C8A2EA4|nr:endolytic transglycosylase MltG [Microbacterium sp. G2-8]